MLCLKHLMLSAIRMRSGISFHRGIQATHFFSWNRKEKRSNNLLITWLAGWATLRNVVVFSSDVRSSSSLSSYIAAGRCGQLSSVCQRKHGPIHQRLLPTMASTVNPLEASSVGLRFFSTYFHWILHLLLILDLQQMFDISYLYSPHSVGHTCYLSRRKTLQFCTPTLHESSCPIL